MPNFSYTGMRSYSAKEPEVSSSCENHFLYVQFCGNIICGVSLLSDAVMRLVNVEYKDQVVDILLRRRSLYIMK